MTIQRGVFVCIEQVFGQALAHFLEITVISKQLIDNLERRW